MGAGGGAGPGTVMHYLARRDDLLAAAEWFAMLRSGAVAVHVANLHPLRQAADAHAALESGRTVGQSVFLVEESPPAP